MNCYLGDKRRSYSLSQNICGALLNIMKTTNYIAMAPLQYFFSVPGMALIQSEINRPQVVTAKCSEPQADTIKVGVKEVV